MQMRPQRNKTDGCGNPGRRRSEVRAALPHYANWPTFPQLFIQGELIGGCDIVEDLKASGELARMVIDVSGAAQA